MDGDLPPPLFEALNRFKRCAEKSGQLFLCFSKLPAGSLKFLRVHRHFSFIPLSLKAGSHQRATLCLHLPAVISTCFTPTEWHADLRLQGPQISTSIPHRGIYIQDDQGGGQSCLSLSAMVPGRSDPSSRFRKNTPWSRIESKRDYGIPALFGRPAGHHATVFCLAFKGKMVHNKLLQKG